MYPCSWTLNARLPRSRTTSLLGTNTAGVVFRWHDSWELGTTRGSVTSFKFTTLGSSIFAFYSQHHSISFNCLDCRFSLTTVISGSHPSTPSVGRPFCLPTRRCGQSRPTGADLAAMAAAGTLPPANPAPWFVKNWWLRHHLIVNGNYWFILPHTMSWVHG